MKALITGITGQDGSYLAELLLSKGYEVHGIIRRSSSFNTERIDHLYQEPGTKNQNLFLHYGDVLDANIIHRLMDQIQPDEVYHLAAQSHVKLSFDMPDYSFDVNALGTIRLLEAIRSQSKKIKFYQASTSELFGKVQETPQSETTPFYPRSPYGVAKLAGYWAVVNYREAYDMFACNGILFNHESPRRGGTFVTRKITIGIAKILQGKLNCLRLGNLDAKRDWGYTPEFVEGMWKILQQDKADDFVLATGETHTVREFVELAFAEAGISIKWQGSGVDEVGVDAKTSKTLVAIDPHYFRPSEVDLLIGDASKAESILDWKAKTKFQELVKIMTQSDLEKSW